MLLHNGISIHREYNINSVPATPQRDVNTHREYNMTSVPATP